MLLVDLLLPCTQLLLTHKVRQVDETYDRQTDDVFCGMPPVRLTSNNAIFLNHMGITEQGWFLS
jgi:hypothetical protein